MGSVLHFELFCEGKRENSQTPDVKDIWSWRPIDKKTQLKSTQSTHEYYMHYKIKDLHMKYNKQNVHLYPSLFCQ